MREPAWIYIIRLAAFALIIIAVVSNNTGSEPRQRARHCRSADGGDRVPDRRSAAGMEVG